MAVLPGVTISVCQFSSVQFSLGPDGIYALGNAHMRFAPSFRSFVSVVREMVLMLCLNVCRVTRVVPTGGQPISNQLTEVVGRMTDSLVIVYASTEAGTVTLRHVTQDNRDTYTDGDNGLPVHGCQVGQALLIY